MKKLIVLLLALITALSFPLYAAGCNGQEPEQPPVTVDDPEPVDKTLPVFIWDYTQFNPQTNWTQRRILFEDFSEYIDNEYRKVCDETLCLWTPVAEIASDGGYNSEGYRYSSHYMGTMVTALKDDETGKCVGTHTFQYIQICSHEWESANVTELSASFVLISGAIKNYEAGEITLEFFELSREMEDYVGLNADFYANIYSGETCIATCYVSEFNDHFTQSWLGEYLKTHIRISKVTEK